MAGESAPAKRPRQDDDDADHRPFKRASYNYSDTISVLVGPKETSFTVHKEVICVKSKFFKAACSETWKEGQERIVRLPDVAPRTFQRYIDWIYGSLLVVGEGSGVADISAMVNLYLLGDVSDDVKLRNRTMKALNDYAYFDKTSTSVELTQKIWDRTTPNSLLRKWIIDEMIMRHSRAQFEAKVAGYPVDFVQQIALKLMQQTPTVKRDIFGAKLTEYLEAEDASESA